MQDLVERLRQFNAERDWDQYHSPKNLCMALAVEAAELMEHFQWLTEAESLSLSLSKREEVAEEIADVLLYLLLLSDKLGIDARGAASAKMQLNSERYPAEQARGKADKYTSYEPASSWGEGTTALSRKEAAQAGFVLSGGITIRSWVEGDWNQVRELALREGWSSYGDEPEMVLGAWRSSRPAIVAVDDGAVIGFVRALTDGALTLYVGELAVGEEYRGRGIARALLDACHRLYPSVRFDLLATEESHGFYQRMGFRAFRGYRKSGAEFDAS